MTVDYNSLIKAIDSLIDKEKNNYHLDTIVLPVTPSWFYSNSVKIYLCDDNYYKIKDMPLNKDILIDWENYNSSDIVEHHEETLSSWYQPFHYIPRDKWGIHLRYDCLISMSKFFFKKGAFDQNHSIELSFLYFTVHELFHYLIESFVSNLEIVLHNPSLYNEYYSKVYKKSFKSKKGIEEELANIYLISEWNNKYNDISCLKDLEEYILIDSGSNSLPTKNKKIRKLITQIITAVIEPNEIFPLDHLLNIRHYHEYINNGFPIWLHYESEVLY